MHFTKTFKERDDLISDLSSNGMHIPDRAKAIGFLTRVGYHRSGAYRYVLRELLPAHLVNRQLREYRSDRYINGASIDDVMTLEAFDMDLARVCLDGTLDFEIRLRAAIAHTLASRGAAAHVDPNCLDPVQCQTFLPPKPRRPPVTKFDAWKATVKRAINTSKVDEDFIAHHLSKYPGQELPVWAAVEVLSFGSLPYLLDLMQPADARDVALKFGIKHPALFATIVRCMADFRNYSAHGSRLFNRHFKRALVVRPFQVNGAELNHVMSRGYTKTPAENKRLYINAAVLAFLLQSHSEPSDWPDQFRAHIESLTLSLLAPDGDLIVTPEKSMGFPQDWQDLDLWS